MGPDKNSNLLGDDSFLTGAIFMSNRATKKECFSRKLFGLPSFQANFVNKIKSGMILFLFEYEERKLYGVFQATSDGSMNIIPMAFSSSGKLFSAQVCFKIIWRCQPLTEAEFRDAIKENYYARNKFHFHLSRTQVIKLLHLFCSQQGCSGGYKFISEFRHPRKNGGKNYQNFRSGKYKPHKESNTDLNMYPDLPGTNLEQLTHHKRSLQNVDDANVDIEAALHPSFSLLEQPELPDIVNSASRGAHAFRGNIPVGPKDDAFYKQVPGLYLKKPSMSSGMNNASVKELASYSVGSLDSHPSSMYKCYHSHPDEDMLSMPSVYQNVGACSKLQDTSYPVHESNCSLPALASKDIRERVSIHSLQDSITRNFQNRVGITNLQNSSHLSAPGFNGHHAPDISSSNQGNYTKLNVNVATSVHSPARIGLLGYSHCATRSQLDDNSRGPRYFQLEHHEIIPSSEYEPNNLEVIESSFCSSPGKASSQMLYASGRSEYQDEGSSYYHLNEDDEYYPVAISPKSHSENREKRPSVFLRLSGLQKAHAEKAENCNSNLDLSLDELVRHLSSRQKHWPRMTEVPSFKSPTKVPEFKKMKLLPAFKNVNKVTDQFVMLDDAEQLENVGQLASHSTVLCNREQSCSQEGTDGTIIPFLNFKRRSEAQRIACGAETSNSVELRENEVSLVKPKRRKLLRPSFDEVDALNKVEVQNVLGETKDECLKGNDDNSTESVNTVTDIGTETHADARSSCVTGGASREHLMEKVKVTFSEHVSNVSPAPASQSDVANQMALSSEGTIYMKGKSKFQNMNESSQNLHGDPLLVVDGNNSGGDKCNADGGKEMEMFLSHAPHLDDAKTDTTAIASGGQCKLQNMQRPFEHLHGGPLLVKVGDSRGSVEHDDVSHITASGSEIRHNAKCSQDCRSCSCYSEGFSKRHACQTSGSVAQDNEVGELSSNQCLGHGEATENVKENVGAGLHLAELDCKNTEDPQSSRPDTQEENPIMKLHFTESDSEITSDSQRNLFKTALGVGLPTAEGSRDIEEKVSALRDQGFDISAKRIESKGLPSKLCIIHTDDHLISGGLLAEVVDKDKKEIQF